MRAITPNRSGRPQPSMESRVAVVTGAGSGIGLATVEELLSAGLTVAATDLDPEPLSALVEAWGEDRIYVGAMNVIERTSIDRSAAAILEVFGRVDILVNSAGVFEPTPALTMDETSMLHLLNVNLCGMLRCTAVFGAIMADQKEGRIINIASLSGVAGAALGSVYAASKGGVIAASRSAARELADKGITVNVVLPGYCDTPMLVSNKALVEHFVVPRIPLKRVASADEVAETILFLATCRTNYMTGSILTIDGGIHAG